MKRGLPHRNMKNMIGLCATFIEKMSWIVVTFEKK